LKKVGKKPGMFIAKQISSSVNHFACSVFK
jgi:hypothetical protein